MKYFQDGGNIPYKDGQDVIDLADLGIFGRRALLNRGFVYQDPTTGELKKYSDDISQLRRDIREARKNERLARRFGSDPNVSNWSQNAQTLYRKRIGTDTPYITLTAQTTPTQQNTPKKSYKYSFENNDMAKAYQELVNSLYTNGSYNILDNYLTDGKITGSGITNALGDNKFKDYVNSLLDNGLNQDQINKILKLVPEWKPQPYQAPTFNTNQIKAYQQAYGIPATGNIRNQTNAMMNKYPMKPESFSGDYYIYDHNGNKYYIDHNGYYYLYGTDDRGTYNYNGGNPTFTPFNKKGGKMIYFQNGGIVQQDNQKQILKAAFTAAAKGDIQTLAKVLGITNEEQFKKFIELTNEMSQQKEDPEMAEMATLALQGLSKVTKAKKGTKLEYIKMLQGKCPEGYEMTYFKLGGKVCKKCQKIEEACKGKKMKCGGESPIVSEFKNKKKK